MHSAFHQTVTPTQKYTTNTLTVLAALTRSTTNTESMTVCIAAVTNTNTRMAPRKVGCVAQSNNVALTAARVIVVGNDVMPRDKMGC